MSGKAIVLDANILIRAVLGKKVRDLIVLNADSVKFFAPDIAYVDARKYLPDILKKRNINESAAMSVLDQLETIIHPIDIILYQSMQQKALQRIAFRDADDWPVLACAMMLGCPVWTEDADFFGTGVATWTSNRIEIYFR
jgi:predicted nucleic acid-binding protein